MSGRCRLRPSLTANEASEPVAVTASLQGLRWPEPSAINAWLVIKRKRSCWAKTAHETPFIVLRSGFIAGTLQTFVSPSCECSGLPSINIIKGILKINKTQATHISELLKDKIMQFSRRVGVNNRNDERVAGPLQLEFRTNRQIVLLLSLSICSFPGCHRTGGPAHCPRAQNRCSPHTYLNNKKNSLTIYKEYKFGGSHISMPLSL